jgi:glc operon protein GlcG
MDVVSWLRSLGFGQYENMFRDDAVIKRGRKIMRSYMWAAVLLAAALLVTGDAKAQQQPAAAGNPLDVVPEKMPFNTPYGTPISLEKAQSAVQAAVAEANKRGWPLNVAVVDSGGNLVTFARMDGAQLASIAISEHKARVAAKYRRPTKAIEEGVQKGITILMTLDDVIASRGGIPLIEDGKLIGAIGCSGATGSQDEVVCSAGAATINR